MKKKSNCCNNCGNYPCIANSKDGYCKSHTKNIKHKYLIYLIEKQPETHVIEIKAKNLSDAKKQALRMIKKLPLYKNTELDGIEEL